MTLYRDQGIVLRTYKLGEADRIVVFVHRAPRQGAGRGQGRAQDEEPVRRPARADEPRGRCSSTRAASSTSSPRPSRSTTSAPSATTSTGSTRAVVDARGGRPDGAGGRGQPAALPDAARRAAGAGRARQRRSWCRRSSGSCWRSRASGPIARRAAPSAAATDALVAFDLDDGRRCCAPTHRRGTARVARGGRRCCSRSSAAQLAAALDEPRLAGHPRGRPPGHPGHGAPPRAPPPLGRPPRPVLTESSRLTGRWRATAWLRRPTGPALTGRVPLDVGVAGRVPHRSVRRPPPATGGPGWGTARHGAGIPLGPTRRTVVSPGISTGWPSYSLFTTSVDAAMSPTRRWPLVVSEVARPITPQKKASMGNSSVRRADRPMPARRPSWRTTRSPSSSLPMVPPAKPWISTEFTTSQAAPLR